MFHVPTIHGIREAVQAVPTSLVVVAVIPMPLWRVYLDAMHDYASVLASVCGILLAVAKLWDHWKGSKEQRTAAAQGIATAAASAAKAGAKAPGLLAGLLAAVGIVAVLGMLTSKRAEAAPVPVQQSVAGRKRKSADDAGDEGDVDAGDAADGPAWYKSAHALTGLHEAAGKRSDPRVSAFFGYVNGFTEKTDARKVPWCAAFVNAMLERNGLTGTRSAMARSFATWGEDTAPRLGCVVVMWRGTYDDGHSGHVGFYAYEDARHVYVLGGNQGDAVSVAKFPKSRVLAYRWPRSLAKSKTVQGSAVAAVGSAATAVTGAVASVAPQGAVVPAPPTVTDTTREVIASAQGPLQQMASALGGTQVAKYLLIGLAVLSLAGALLAIHGRRDVRNKTGV